MIKSRTNSPRRDQARLASDVLVQLDRNATEPLHRQIEVSIRDSIRSGRLPIGASLPPTRTVAADLGVSRGVVVEAYQQLTAEGYLASRSGGYTQVAAGSEPAARAQTPVPHRTPVVNFGYGRADLSAFPRTAWLRSVRRVFAETPNEHFGYLSGQGVPELRIALADYLNRVRGTSAAADNMVICSGYAQGINLILRVLANRGAKLVAVEDPSTNDDARPYAASIGLQLVGVPVGEHGIEVGALAHSNADAVILTPSHQWPTGGVLSAQSRAAILTWAGEHNALVIEDDYDAEYRYDRTPIGAMQGLAPDQVVYTGSASKTLAPGLRLGWLILPPRLVDDVAAEKIIADRGSPVIDQLTFADFLRHGEFDRHLRRMRPIYRRRRDTLLAALADKTPDLEPAGIAAGLHVITWLPSDLDEATVVEAAVARGLAISGVGAYRLNPSTQGGLIFGYSNLDEKAIVRGIEMLSKIVAELRAG
jgi:GntR family transcriptional regulator/MocR family aminotransferase